MGKSKQKLAAVQAAYDKAMAEYESVKGDEQYIALGCFLDDLWFALEGAPEVKPVRVQKITQYELETFPYTAGSSFEIETPVGPYYAHSSDGIELLYYHAKADLLEAL